MKKVSLLIAMIAFVCGNAFAQFSYDFTGCPAGAKVAQTLGLPWTTWSDAPGGSEDGVFGEVDGNMAAYFTYGVDQVVALGEKTTGVYDIEFDIYIEENYMGYFNIMHHHPCNSDQAIQVYLQATNTGNSGDPTTMSDGHGSVHAGGHQAVDLPCYWNDWMHFRIHVDCDTDIAELYFDGTLMHTWQWSLDSFGQEGYSDRTLGGIDFFPPGNASNSRYYVDNVVFSSQQGEVELVNDPFEEYTVGNKIAVEAIAAGHDWWTTWTNAPGGAEDGVVAEFEGTQCGHLTYGNDQVLLLDDGDNGFYTMSFDMYIPTGKDAYNNLLHVFNGSGSEWATEVHYKTSSSGTAIEAGGVTTNFECPYDAWFNVKYEVDLTNDVATFFVDNVEVCTWQYSLQAEGDAGLRQVAALDFYPPTSAAVSDYYIDNVLVTKVVSESAPHFVVTPESVTKELAEDDMTNVEIVLENQGNSIGDWNGYIDFGQGGTGSQTSELYYHNGTPYTGIGYSEAMTREMGIRLPASAYAGAAMGMRIVSAKFFVHSDDASEDNTYSFRVYGQGTNGQPGELLAEKTIVTSTLGDWIEATFDDPVYMNGQIIWVTVFLNQAADQYPCTMDDGHYGEESDGNWLSSRGGNFSHCYSSGSFEGSWMISVNCQGELIPATWATIDKTEGAILGGHSETITLTLNSIGLAMGTNYEANLIINTNDEEMAHVEIPVLLAVTDGVEETVAQIASIYPNPATSSVTLEGQNLSAVAIYNVAGQLVRIEQLGSVSNTISLDLESGVYFFSVYDDNGNNSVQRVVIAK